MPDLITTVFDPPQASDDPAVFDAKATDTANKLNAFGGELNAAGVTINGYANTASTAATTATTAKTDAESARDAAIAAGAMVAATWQASTAYVLNDRVWGDASSGSLYRCILGYAGGTTPPASDPTHWVAVLVTRAELVALQSAVDATKDVPPSYRTSASTLALTDRATGIETNSGVTIPTNATVAFPGGATVLVYNYSASNTTVTPAAGVTLRKAGTTTTGAINVAPYGLVTLRRTNTADTWVASGNIAA